MIESSKIDLKKIKISSFFIIGIVIGTLVRIPISDEMNISAYEVVLLLTILMLPLYLKFQDLRKYKISIEFFMIIMAIIILIMIQCFVNGERIISIALLFEYLFIGILFLFIFKSIGFNHKTYYRILVLFSLYLSVNSMYFNVLNYKIGGIISVLKFGSVNYTSAVMLLIIPVLYFYIRQSVDKRFDIITYISIILMMISIIFSGSRSNIVVLAFQIFTYIFLTKNNIRKRVKMIIGLILLMFLGYQIISIVNPNLKFIFDRYLLFFTGNTEMRNDIVGSDEARRYFISEAKIIISQNKYFGTGFAKLPGSYIPVHNFIYEIILAIGYTGFLVYVIYFFIMIKNTLRCMKSKNSNRVLVLTMIVTFLSISMVHPFMTTGKEFSAIFWMSMVAFKMYI